MTFSEERLSEFNARLNQWIGRQGLLFQLTHGRAILGEKGYLFGLILRIFITLLAFFAVIGFGYFGYRYFQVSGKNFGTVLVPSIEEALDVPDVYSSGYNRSSDVGQFRQLMAEGTSETFFNVFELKNVSFLMPPAQVLFGDWKAGSIRADSLNLSLKAGAVSDEAAQSAWSQFFKDVEGFSFDRFEVNDTNLSWGYRTSSTWGGIRNSRLQASRIEDRWNLRFSGGTFSHGIFRNFELRKLNASLTKQGSLKITEVDMGLGQGQVAWNANVVSGISQPQFEGKGTFSSIPTTAFFPKEINQNLGGTLSGSFHFSGSTNDVDGIIFDIDVQLDGVRDQLFLTHELPLLRLLSALDSENSYRKASFNAGGFKVNVKGDEWSVQDIDLFTSGDVIETNSNCKLLGEILIRPPSTQELLEQFSDLDSLKRMQELDNIYEITNFQEVDRRILQTVFRDVQYTQPPTKLEFITTDNDGNELERPFIEEEARRQIRFPSFLSGHLKLGVPKGGLENASSLPGMLPSDEESHQLIEIPLSYLETELTKELTDEWDAQLKKSN